MKNFIKFLFFFIGILSLNACVIQKPEGSIQEADYNKRQQVTKASYSKKATTIGIITTIGATTGGAIIGHQTEPIQTNTSEQAAKPVPAANVALGAAIGYGISSFINHVILGQGQRNIRVDKNSEWIRKKFGNDKILLRTNPAGFVIIDRSIEENFIVKDMADVNDFFLAFPDAILYNKDKVIAQAIKKVDRSDLPTLMTLAPQTSHKRDLHEKYLALSKSLEELYDAIDRFPSIKSNAEESIASKVRSMSDLRKFVSTYPDSKVITLYLKGLVTYLDKKDIPKLLSMYPNHPETNYFKEQYIKKSANLSDAISALNEYPNLVDAPSFTLKFVKTKDDAYKYKRTYPDSKNILLVDSTGFYVGNLSSGKPHGYGVTVYDNGREHYEGNFYNGLFSGEGRKYVTEGKLMTVKSGSFASGILSKGTEEKYYNNTIAGTYKGEFLRGEYHGNGELSVKGDYREYFPDIQATQKEAFVYVGTFKEGKITGYGKLSHKAFFERKGTTGEKDEYEGGFYNGKFSGYGTRKNIDGTISGNWKDGREDGEFKGKTSDGYDLIGDYENGKREGLFSFTKEGGWFGSDKHINVTYRNGVEISSKDIMASHSSSSSSSSSGGCSGAKEGNMSVPSYEVTEDWEEYSGFFDGTYYKQEIKFEDRIEGYVFRGGSSKKYFLSSGSTNYYYKSYADAIYALYIYKKCDVFTNRGRD